MTYLIFLYIRLKNTEEDYEKDKELLLELIKFIINKIAFLFTYEDRKMFLFLLLCYYLGEKSKNFHLNLKY